MDYNNGFSLSFFFNLFLLFIVSEGLLFVSFFWTSFHSLSSPTLGTWPGEGFYLPDPCELTFANTLLLSNAAISLGNAFISLEISSSFFIFFSLFSFMLGWTFISLQIKEFRIMGLSINDSVYSCLFFFLTGLHFFHLLLGLLLLSLLTAVSLSSLCSVSAWRALLNYKQITHKRREPILIESRSGRFQPIHESTWGFHMGHNIRNI
jgi:heme/copper-type cytochrome/quinol oxidase subunit 3